MYEHTGRGVRVCVSYTAGIVHIPLLKWRWTTLFLQYSRSPAWNGLVEVSNSLLEEHVQNCCRDVGGGSLFLTVVPKTDQNGFSAGQGGTELTVGCT